MFASAVTAVAIILILISMGLLGRKLKWFDGKVAASFPRIITNICVPAQIFTAFTTYMPDLSSIDAAVVLVPFVAQPTMFMLALGLSYILKIDERRRGVFCTLCALANSVFMGFPIVETIFGESGLVYATFFYVANTTTFWTLGCYWTQLDGEAATGKKVPFSPGAFLKRLVTPPMVTIALTLALILLKLQLPGIITRSAGYLGAMATPLSMLYLGSLIYDMGRSVFKPEKGLIAAVVMRLVVSFGVIYAISAIFGLSREAMSVYCVQGALPVIAATTIVAAMYNADSQYAMKGIAWTTGCSLITIPLLSLLL